MKKYLLLLCCIASLLKVNATHLMGGDLVVTHITGNTYNVRLTHYRDTLGIPLGTFQEIFLYQLNTSTGDYNLTQQLSVNQDIAQSTALVANFPYGVEVGVYDTTLAFTAGNYRIVTYECCRNCAILNAGNPCGEDMELYTDFEVYSANSNSTPDFLNMPIAHFPANSTSTYNPLPYDVDGDSVSWALNIPIGGSYPSSPVAMNPTFTSVAGFTTPPGNTTAPFTMNPVTGEVNWSPNTTGNFIQSFIVKEYRNGAQIGSIVRDMQYVVDNTPIASAFTTVSNYITNAQEHYNYIYYTPGQQVVFKISGTAQIPNVNLSMECSGAPFHLAAPATFGTTGSGSNITGTLTWTPPAGFTKDEVVAFRLKDGYHANDFTLLMRRNPNATAVSNVAGGVTAFSVYPNPASKTIHLKFDLQKDVDASIGMYNAAGQLVKNLYTGSVHKGKCTLSDNMDLPAGQYFIEIKGGGQLLHMAAITIE